MVIPRKARKHINPNCHGHGQPPQQRFPPAFLSQRRGNIQWDQRHRQGQRMSDNAETSLRNKLRQAYIGHGIGHNEYHRHQGHRDITVSHALGPFGLSNFSRHGKGKGKTGKPQEQGSSALSIEPHVTITVNPFDNMIKIYPRRTFPYSTAS